jgi:uncharacterized membrane protein
VTQQFSGPIPPPEMLERFERVVPGSATMIVDQAREQTGHRMGLES